MAILKCKMCGGDLNITAEEKIIECEYCGSTQTVPDGSDEKKTNLFNRANRLRMDNEFDKASGVYESIVSEFPEEAEGYWGLVLCSYGIEYVDDSKTGKKIPTCHRTLTSSVMDDDNFVQACENADVVARGIYREEAKAIDKLQQKIIAVVENEEPYDVFICYKETDDITKSRTEDSLIAQDIYTELIKEGYKVFFARVTLRDKAGTEYEPYIYAALKSAKIMLAIGTKFDYYDAVWVKNEWSRYISMMADDSSKHLIPCFKNLDAYDIPKEFKNLQALDMGEVTFFKNLTDNVERFIPKETKVTMEEIYSEGNTTSVDSLLKRAFMFLEDGIWNKADEYAEKVLDVFPECGEAYLLKLMVDLKVTKQEDLAECESFEKNQNYQKIVHFGKDDLKNQVQNYLIQTTQRISQKQNYYIVNNGIKNVIASQSRTVGLKADGTVVTTSFRDEVTAWRNIVAIFKGIFSTIGLKTDGTVLATGFNYDGECNVEDWENIVSVACGRDFTIGLKKDGTVVAAGNNKKGQCNVQSWKDIIATYVGLDFTIGLTVDGTVIATGDLPSEKYDFRSWEDIVSIITSPDGAYVAGLKVDGTVVATGYDKYGQCNVSDWDNIVNISGNKFHMVGLKVDKTVVATGLNTSNQCNVSDWRDIVSISCGSDHTVGLKADGTVIATGNNDFGQCNTEDWKNIVAISCSSDHTVGLKADGTVIAVGRNKYQECNVDTWENIALPIGTNNYDEFLKLRGKEIDIAVKQQEEELQRLNPDERKKLDEYRKCEQQINSYKRQGVCQHCGGNFKGLFTKKCVNCGKPKDY